MTDGSPRNKRWWLSRAAACKSAGTSAVPSGVGQATEFAPHSRPQPGCAGEQSAPQQQAWAWPEPARN
jgi:hypothetical protein